MTTRSKFDHSGLVKSRTSEDIRMSLGSFIARGELHTPSLTNLGLSYEDACAVFRGFQDFMEEFITSADLDKEEEKLQALTAQAWATAVALCGRPSSKDQYPLSYTDGDPYSYSDGYDGACVVVGKLPAPAEFLDD